MRAIDGDALREKLNELYGYERTKEMQQIIMEQATIKTEKKTYIVFYDGKIGYIEHICKCEKCIKRKSYEWFINDLSGIYLDCIKPEDISKEVLYIGDNLAQGIESLNQYYKNEIDIKSNEVKLLESVNELYRKEIFDKIK